MEKNLIYGDLLDIYSGLLTQKQAEAMDYYYCRDYSLGEISELMDISRQGVRAFIKRAEAIIDEMEEKLHLLPRFRAAADIKELAEGIIEENKRLSGVKKIEALAKKIIDASVIMENGA